ncbi:type II toxin-antitoxin system PemK/MazF family toxin [Jeotgalibaca dankookensis]|uniref:type II toxin-antitoxin system PemK/MazF family toxin n=1 Tax=Jeotgalibaca dankookensis TaxID=708126 RepID=UPI0014702519|nr:type II toxin-antitoxin system PemK/MazF family toxin [Jeotgalibaca dankookensis]
MQNSENGKRELQFGDIVSINFLEGAVGHEQMGNRPAIILSDKPSRLSMVTIAPITNTDNSFPLHIPLTDTVITTGFILMEQIRAVDKKARNLTFIEAAPKSVINQVSLIFKAQYQNLLE